MKFAGGLRLRHFIPFYFCVLLLACLGLMVIIGQKGVGYEGVFSTN